MCTILRVCFRMKYIESLINSALVHFRQPLVQQNVNIILWTCTEPQRQPLWVEEQALPLSLIRWRHVEVAADDPLQVAVLPVEVAGLDGSTEHRPPRPGQGV